MRKKLRGTFILKNSQVLLDKMEEIKSLSSLSNYTNTNEIQKNSFTLASEIKKKTDFAFDVMMIDEWSTPKYIKDGLTWLK